MKHLVYALTPLVSFIFLAAPVDLSLLRLRGSAVPLAAHIQYYSDANPIRITALPDFGLVITMASPSSAMSKEATVGAAISAIKNYRSSLLGLKEEDSVAVSFDYHEADVRYEVLVVQNGKGQIRWYYNGVPQPVP